MIDGPGVLNCLWWQQQHVQALLCCVISHPYEHLYWRLKHPHDASAVSILFRNADDTSWHVTVSGQRDRNEKFLLDDLCDLCTCVAKVYMLEVSSGLSLRLLL